MADVKLTKLGVEDALEKLDSKLEKMEHHLNSIDKTLVRNTISLEEHMRRTKQNEESIGLLADSMKPIQKHVSQVETVLKVVGLAGSALLGIIGIITGVIKVIDLIK